MSQGILYIQSVLKADNEDETTFTQSAVIDLYALRDGKYRGSLYLRNERETRLFDFKISGNKLIALFDGYAALFEIDPGLISQLRVDRSKQFGGSEREGL